MENTIIIIESPNKEAKIAKYTGAKVFATKGHFKTLTDDIIKDYENYEPIFEFKDKNSKFNINKILDECKGKEVIIATDPDREGYAIGYLFYQMVKNSAKSIKRAEFHEITENGIKKGLENALPYTSTNLKEFEAFKGRAVGDKLIGFILSPKYIRTLNDKDISVGRVQTPALNLIVKRELEIKEFNENAENKKLSYKIKAKLKKGDKEFYAINDNVYDTKESAEQKIADLKAITKAKVYEVKSKENEIKPKEPMRTSQFQEQCAKQFGLKSDKAMSIAQKLFEKGLITYIRTDSNSISEEFIDEVAKHFGSNEWHEKREYKSGDQSQAEAHEAIRISHIHDFKDIDKIASDESLSDDEKKVYTLIYANSLLSQAKNAKTLNFTYDIDIKALSFKATSSKTTYKGFKGVFESFEIADDTETPENEVKELELNKDEELQILDYELSEVKKKAPTHYKESNFISLLEKEKIGRPSTYATFLPKLLDKNYITIQKKGKNDEIIATPKGINFIKTLKDNGDEWITKSEFTAYMENILDEISKGKLNYLDFIKPIHEKMNFEKINQEREQKMYPPSEKQINLAKKLANEQGLDLPENLEQDFKVCKDFIDKALKSQPPKEPSAKQIEWARKIANNKNIELPDECLKDMKKCSEFINKYK